MEYYIEESITPFGEALDAKVSLPAKKSLQNINGNSPRLGKQRAYTLHYIVVNLLWMAKMSRPEI